MVRIARRLWHAVKYFRAPVVNSRAELDEALARAPRYIVVLGDEALRADAAAMAHQGQQEAALLEAEALIAKGVLRDPRVPQLGRIRTGRRGYAPVQSSRARRRGMLDSLAQPGMAAVLAAVLGLGGALTVELLALPAANPELIRGDRVPPKPHRRGEVVKLPTHAPTPPPPSLGVRIVHVVIPILGGLAVVALCYLVWDAARPGTVMVRWRVDYRIQGRLVIGRVRTRIA